MKRLLIIVGILVVLSWGMVPISEAMVEQAFKHRDKKWAPGLAITGARLEMYMLQYDKARPAFEQILVVFPAHAARDRVHYYIGFCHEKLRNYKQAREWYQRFLTYWPSHPWAGEVNRRETNLGDLQ